jgi:broad specificity phosphatase PhoE
MSKLVVLVKHALPILDFTRAPCDWTLGDEGKVQARILSKKLQRYLPFELISSPEVKASGTAEVVGKELGLEFHVVYGLEEINRPRMRKLDPEELSTLIREIFLKPDKEVVGRETAEQALARFDKGLREAISGYEAGNNLVVISHGIVISLFVQAKNRMNGHKLWRRLQCPSFIVLSFPSYQVLEIVDDLRSGG